MKWKAKVWKVPYAGVWYARGTLATDNEIGVYYKHFYTWKEAISWALNPRF